MIALGLPASTACAVEDPVERPLSHLRARAGAPLPLGERVVVGGWITHVCAANRCLALLEGEAGQVFAVDDAAWLRPLSTGTWIRVEATVEARLGRLHLRSPRTVPRATGADATLRPPAPSPATPGFLELHSTAAQGRWLTLRATVRAQGPARTEDSSTWRLQLARDAQRIAADVCHTEGLAPFLRPGDTVELTGVLAPPGREPGHLPVNRLLVQTPACIRVVARGAESPFDLALVPLADIQLASDAVPLGGQVRVRGQVSHRTAGQVLWLESGGAALRVLLGDADTSPVGAGDWVDAAGFTAFKEGVGLLEDAVLRTLGRRDPIAPTRVTPGPDTASDWHDHLVRCPGRLESLHREASGFRLGLSSGETAFDAFLPRHAFPVLPPDLVPGAEVEVTGICGGLLAEGPRMEGGVPAGFSLLPRAVTDLVVITPAPFWSADRLRRAFVWGSICLAGAAVWILTLRVQVSRRSRRLAAEIQARQEETVAFSSVLQERKRLAADLHDSLAQSLTGIAFQLQAAEMAREKAPENVEKHLDLARRLLEQGRTELRRSLWDLRSEALDLHDLAGALREMAKRHATEDDLQIVVVEEGESRPIPDLVANHLLRIAQEALHNARQRGRASRVDIVLLHAPGRVGLRLRDNGQGFVPALVPGPQGGHFGLNSMRERAQRLGGTFALESRPGDGTLIQVFMPL